jgi:small subunit ribosomal protein S19e
MAKKIFSQNAEEYVVLLAEALKKIPEFEVPEWSLYVKSGMSRERPPAHVDFWYIRAASILRQLYIKGVVGVGRLRTRYGTRKDRGGSPDKFRKSGGKIIRVILQQAEKAGFVEKLSHLQHGRRLTAQGRDFLDSIETPEKEALDLTNVLVKTVPTSVEQEVLETPEEVPISTDESEEEKEESKEEKKKEETEVKEKKEESEVKEKEETKEEKKKEESKEEEEKEESEVKDEGDNSPLGVPQKAELGGKDGI